MNRVLDVYLHEQRVGKLKQSSAGALEFQYDSE